MDFPIPATVKALEGKRTPDEVRRLDEASATAPIYAYWHRRRSNSEHVPQLGDARQ